MDDFEVLEVIGRGAFGEVKVSECCIWPRALLSVTTDIYVYSHVHVFVCVCVCNMLLIR